MRLSLMYVCICVLELNIQFQNSSSYSITSMTGVPIYTESPITPAKPSGVTPQTAIKDQTPPTATQSAPGIASSNLNYPPPQPGPVATIATPTRAPNSHYQPPPPQPGAFPSAPAPAITAKPSLPPPPRVGEVPKPPEYYAPQHSPPKTSMQQRQYPPQMMLSMTEPSNGQPPSSTTSTATYTPAFTPSTSLPTTGRLKPTPTSPLPGNNYDSGQLEAAAGVSLDHPPGYVQNPYASNDTLPDHRFATEQTTNSPRRGQPLGLGGYNDNPSHNINTTSSSSGFEDEESVWGMAKKWAKGASDTVGNYVTDINEKISRNLDNGK